MAFRYSLESLLRLRRSVERQEELRLLAIASTVARLRAELQELDDARFARRRSAQQSLATGGAGSMLHFDAACDASYFKVRSARLQELAKAERLRREQLERYQDARQKTEILLALRSHQQEAYNLEFLRREQQLIDEAFLVRSHQRLAD